MTDERIFAYLLGELPEEESERFEEECFAGDDWPEQIKLAEDDLIDAYVREELTPEQRQHFELNYLTTEARLKRVAMAAALLRHVDTFGNDEARAPTAVEQTWISSLIASWGSWRWALRAGLAVGVVAVVVGGLWFSRPRVASPRVLATLTLTISSDDNNRAEGAEPGRVKLQPDAEGVLRIYLKLPRQPTAAAYRVELMNEDGETKPLDITGRDAESVLVEIPSARLTRGQYALKIFAVRPDGAEQRVSGIYLFNVE